MFHEIKGYSQRWEHRPLVAEEEGSPVAVLSC